MGHLVRILVWASAAGVYWLVDQRQRKSVAIAAGLAVVMGFRLLLAILARMAHGSFRKGDADRAELLYRILRVLTPRPAVRHAIRVSEAGCRLVRGDYPGALEQLEQVDAARLGSVARAMWLNNLAYARARGGGDARQSLAEIDEAMALCPDLGGFHHTRAVSLLALGRTDEAIRELDAVHAMDGGEPDAALEAERCYDLAGAWRRKGEAEYADDYFVRAQTVAPDTRWAKLAGEALVGRPAASPRRGTPRESVPPAAGP